MERLWNIVDQANSANPPGITWDELKDIMKVVDGHSTSFVLERETKNGMANAQTVLKELQRGMRAIRKTDKHFPYVFTMVKNEHNQSQQYLLIVNTATETAATMTQLQDTGLFFGHVDKGMLKSYLNECGYKLENGEIKTPKQLRTHCSICASCGKMVLQDS